MRILVVEDEKRIQDFLSRGLESAGYAVDVAGNGATAVDLVHGAEYDLIILDLMLPDMDGLTVLQKIRNRKSSPPVLILSARDAVDDKVKGLELGADDYLVKPFAFVELLARVRARLRRGQPMPERLQVGDLLLDCIRRKVTRSNENIELAPKEFSILEYLMRNRGRPLSRTMIVEHVWDMDYDGLTNIVDVYIRHLRSKIDDKFTVKMIHTVRGIGYMLDTPEKTVETRRWNRSHDRDDASMITPGKAAGLDSRTALPSGLELRHSSSASCWCSSALLFRQILSGDFQSQMESVLDEEWGAAKGYLAHRAGRSELVLRRKGSGRKLHGPPRAARLSCWPIRRATAAAFRKSTIRWASIAVRDSGHPSVRQTGHPRTHRPPAAFPT